ncbi:MAG: extradiol dioxygenase family protein [Alphaproteobacteria bacterium]|jgi:extradiol dioxygenase family protein
MLTPFHLAIPVNNLEDAAHFYGHVLGCQQGRCDTHWIDWNFFGHQLVTHLVDVMPNAIQPNQVDSKSVPVPHFGVILNEQSWLQVIASIKANNIEFQIDPYIRFKGKTGEQGTFFLFDTAGNALEFKYFNDHTQIFAA